MSASVSAQPVVTRRGIDRSRLWPAGIGVLTTAFVLYGLTRPHALFGVVQYDDGVYFDSALRLVRGQVPYRDFTFVQPPGIAVLFSPVALVARHIGSRDGLAIARCITAIVTGGNAYLAGRLIAHRGAAVATFAAAIMGFFPAAVFADRTLLLEPYVVLFCLLGATSCFHDGHLRSARGLALGGIFFGVAISTKVWAILIVISMLIVIGSDATASGASRIRRAKRAGTLLGSTVAATAVVCLPFFVLAPRSFLHDVVSAQLNRRSGSGAPIWTRLSDIVGINGSNAVPTPEITYVVTALIVAVLLFGAVIPAVRCTSSVVERFVCVATIISVTAVLVPSEYFNHYPYFVVPFLAGALVVSLDRLFQSSKRIHLSANVRRALFVTAIGALVAGSCGLVVGEARFGNTLLQSSGDPSLAIDLAIPAGTCAVSDAVILLIEANRADPESGACPPLVDPTGIWLATAPKEQPLGCAPINPTLVHAWQNLLARADFFVESGSAQSRLPWTIGLRAWFNANFRHIPDPGANIFVRVGTRYVSAALDPARWTPARLLSEGWHAPHHPQTTHRQKLPACLSSRT